METSKKIVLFAGTIFSITLIAALSSWFMYREAPSEIMAWVTGLLCTAVGFYKWKACQENKIKINKPTKKVGDLL